MAKFALACLALLAVATLVVEADLLSRKQWKEVEKYAKAHKDFDGHSLMEWYNSEFSDTSVKRSSDTKLRNILELIVYNLKASKPQDCNYEHLKRLAKFEKEGMRTSFLDGPKFENLVEIYAEQTRKYSRLCQMRVIQAYNKGVATLDPAQLALVKKFTETTMDQDSDAYEYDWIIKDLDSSSLRDKYLEIEADYSDFNRKKLAAACKSYVAAVEGVYEPLQAYLWKAKYTAYERVEGSSDPMLGFISKVYCKSYLRNSWLHWIV